MTFKVKAERCDQCLFSPQRIVSAARVREILAQCKQDDTHFICHKTDDTCCRGFYDTRSSQMIQIAQRLDMLEFVP